MASIGSPVISIASINFNPDKPDRLINVAKIVKLKGDTGWLALDDKGTVHPIGRCYEWVTQRSHIVGVTAEPGTIWGSVLDGLVALGKVTRKDLNKHREALVKYKEQRERSEARHTITRLAEKHGLNVEVKD